METKWSKHSNMEQLTLHVQAPNISSPQGAGHFFGDGITMVAFVNTSLAGEGDLCIDFTGETGLTLRGRPLFLGALGGCGCG